MVRLFRVMCVCVCEIEGCVCFICAMDRLLQICNLESLGHAHFCCSCSGGELFHECVIEESFVEKDVIHLLVQILEGLCFLHENNIVHLDLKVG